MKRILRTPPRAGTALTMLLVGSAILISCAKNTGAPAGAPAPGAGTLERAAPPAQADVASAADGASDAATAAPRVVREPILYTEKPELTDYVRAVGKRVASQVKGSAIAYRFDIVDSADVNAYALPGGRVLVTRGLLARMSSEDELAAALSREVAAASAPRDGAAGEVDALGMKYARSAGYKPRGAADLLRTLAAVRAAEPERLDLWLEAHPGSAARLANIADAIQKIPEAGGESSARALKRDPYLQKIDGLAVGWCGPAGCLKGSRYVDVRKDYSILVPAGWTIEPGPESLVLMKPAESLRAEVVVRPMLRPGVSGDAALDEARKAPEEGYVVMKPVGHASLPTGEAAIVTLQRQEAGVGTVSVRKMLQTRFDRVYVLTLRVPADLEEETADTFMALTGSIKWLKADEAKPLETPRLTLEKAKADDTWKSIATERLGGDWRAAALAAWNGRDPSEPPVAGMSIKIPPTSVFE